MNTITSPSISDNFPCNDALLAAERCQQAWVAIVPLLGSGIPEIRQSDRVRVVGESLRVLCEWRMVRLVRRDGPWAVPHFLVECGLRMLILDIISKYDMALVPSSIGWTHELLADELLSVSTSLVPCASFDALTDYITAALTVNWDSAHDGLLGKLAFHSLIDTRTAAEDSVPVNKGLLEMMERTSVVLAARAAVQWVVRIAVEVTECDTSHSALLAWFRHRATQQHAENVRTAMRERLIATELSPLHSGTGDPASKVAAQTDPTRAQAIIDKFSHPFHEFIGDNAECECPAASDAVLIGLFDYYMHQLFAVEWINHYTCDNRDPLFTTRRLSSYAQDRMKSPPPLILQLGGASYVLTRGNQAGTIERCTRHTTVARAMVEWIRIITVEREGKLTLGKNIGQFVHGIIKPSALPTAVTTTMDVGLINMV